MTASEMIERDCQRALAKINHSIGTKAGILKARVREQFRQLRAPDNFGAGKAVLPVVSVDAEMFEEDEEERLIREIANGAKFEVVPFSFSHLRSYP